MRAGPRLSVVLSVFYGKATPIFRGIAWRGLCLGAAQDAAIRVNGHDPTGQVETGVAWGRENRTRRREPAGSIPPRSMANSACRTSELGTGGRRQAEGPGF